MKRYIAVLIFALGTLLPVQHLQAADCGGNNQRPCKLWERVPSCNAGLIENFAQGKCISIPAPRPIAVNCGMQNGTPCKVWQRVPSCNNGLVEDFIKNQCVAGDPIISRGSYVVRNSSGFVAVLNNVLNCMGDPNRNAAFRRAVDAQNLVAAQNAVDACIGGDTLNALRRSPVADMSQASNKGFSLISSAHAGSNDVVHNMLTIGISGGGMVFAGVNGETGIAIPLNGQGVTRFYVTGDWALGFGITAGASLVVGVGTDNVVPGDSIGKSLVYSGKALAGGGVSVNYDVEPVAYNGIAISGGVGAGGEVMTVHQSATHIF